MSVASIGLALLVSQFRSALQRARRSAEHLANKNRDLTNEIAERKQAEELLRASEQRFRALFETMAEGVALHEMIYDERGTPIDYKILDVNPAYPLHVGIVRQDAVGKNAAELYGTGTPPYFDLFGRVAATGEPARFETYFEPLRKYFSISVCSPGNGQFATVFEDITDRKRAEEELQKHREHLENLVKERTAKFEAANTDLNKFIYAAAHDLKTPLRGINQLASWLVHDYADLFDAPGKEKMTSLMNRVTRMYRLIEGIREYSEIGRMVQPQEPIDVDRLVRDVLDMLAPPEHIRISIQPELPAIVGDAAGVSEIFRNLIENAVKFMKKPAGEIAIRGSDQDGYRQFSVTDNGPGIEKKYHEKIFQLFQTLSSRDEQENIGIGLAVAKKIVECSGGKIWVESEPENGSTFFFTLPDQE